MKNHANRNIGTVKLALILRLATELYADMISYSPLTEIFPTYFADALAAEWRL